MSSSRQLDDDPSCDNDNPLDRTPSDVTGRKEKKRGDHTSRVLLRIFSSVIDTLKAPLIDPDILRPGWAQ